MIPIVTCPPRLVGLSAMFDWHYGLAHIILQRGHDSLYVRMLQHLRGRDTTFGKYLIVDNGVTETGEPVSIDKLLIAARMVNADEAVLPDIFDDGEATLKLVRESVPKVKEHIKKLATNPSIRPYSFMAVAHGKTLTSVMSVIHEYIENHMAIKVIGIPKVLTRNLRNVGGRIRVLREIEKEQLHTHIKFHMLGVWEDMNEVKQVSQQFPWVRSIDTSWPIMAACNGVHIEEFPKDKYSWIEHAMLTNWELMSKNLLTYWRWSNEK